MDWRRNYLTHPLRGFLQHGQTCDLITDRSMHEQCIHGLVVVVVVVLIVGEDGERTSFGRRSTPGVDRQFIKGIVEYNQ